MAQTKKKGFLLHSSGNRNWYYAAVPLPSVPASLYHANRHGNSGYFHRYAVFMDDFRPDYLQYSLYLFSGTFRIQHHERGADLHLWQSDSRSGSLSADSDQLSHREQLNGILRTIFPDQEDLPRPPLGAGILYHAWLHAHGRVYGRLYPDLLILPDPL